MLLVVAVDPAQAQDSKLEHHRLELDIQRLQREASWQASAQRWLPAASIFVAAIVAAYGVWRYFDERSRAQAVRTEEAVAHNLERLIDRPSEGASARSIAALRNLDGLAAVESGSKADGHRSRVTDTVTVIVRDDLTALATPDDARLPFICLSNWAEFERRVRDDEELCRTVLTRYLEALEEIGRRSPQYVAAVRRENGRYLSERGSLSKDDALLFPAIVAGFESYVSVLSGDTHLEMINEFSRVAQALGQQLLLHVR
jgi:hypothetical protein